MTRYKGRPSAKAVEEDFPHFVDIAVPLGGLGTKPLAMIARLTAATNESFDFIAKPPLNVLKGRLPRGHAAPFAGWPQCKPGMSAIHPKADMCSALAHVRFVPIADISQCYSITSLACASTDGGTVRPSALAVLRLIASSNLVGACTGRSAGFSPLRIRST